MPIPVVQVTADEERSETVLRDRFGEPIMTLRTLLRTESTGAGEQKTRNLESITLVDGFMWNAGMLVSNPPVHITCCDLCRRPPWRLFGIEKPTHGLLTVQNAAQCHRCGKVLCPRHRVEFGPVVRCVSCARRRRIWNAVLYLFTREE